MGAKSTNLSVSINHRVIVRTYCLRDEGLKMMSFARDSSVTGPTDGLTGGILGMLSGIGKGAGGVGWLTEVELPAGGPAGRMPACLNMFIRAIGSVGIGRGACVTAGFWGSVRWGGVGTGMAGGGGGG